MSMTTAKQLAVLALLGGALPALAQTGTRPAATAAPAAPRATTGRITGTVTDAATGKPVSYATVAVINPATNSAVNGGVAGDDGQFVLPGIPAGTYRAEISFLGYTTVSRSVTVPATGGAVALGTVALAASAQKLGEVVVTGRKPLIEEKVDRTVYNADVDKTTQGGDATDVLKRVPLLSVDLDGNVSLRGSSNIKVLINNKPSTIAASSIADALKQIPADQIQTVEVITSPSAKYDAEGSGGIINIITKSNNLVGGSLGVDLSAGTRSSNLGLNGNYRKGKFGVSLSGFGRAAYNQPGSFDNTQSSVSAIQDASNPSGFDVTKTTVQQTADTRQRQVFGRYTLGLTYDFDKHNSLAGSLAYGLRNGKNYQDNLVSDVLQGPVLGISSVRDVATTSNSGTVDASLNYTHTYQKEQRELSFLTLFSRNNQTSDFTNDIFAPSDRHYLGLIGNNNDSHNQEITGQVDYATPTAKNQLLELGAKDILRRVTSDYSYFGDTSLQPIGTPSNSFVYRQNVTAAYITYTLGLPKGFTFKPGLRYEYTTISADFKQGDQTGQSTAIPNYGVLVPSVNLSRKLANGNVLKLAYNRRIQRPSLQFLNPNLQASNPLNATQGNTALRPEFTNNYELGYSTQIKQKVNVNLSTFVRNTTGSIQAIRTPRNDGAILTTYLNAGNEDAYGGSLFVSSNAGKLTLNAGTDMYYAVLRNNNPDPVFDSHNQGFVISGRAFGSYTLSKGWALQGFAFYRARQVQLQGYQSGFGIYSLNIRRDFAEKRGSIGFGAENFFTPSINIRTNVSTPYVESYYGTPIYSPVLSQSSTNVLHNMSFKVNFSYRVGKLTVAPTNAEGKTINNDDLKGGEGGGGDMGGGMGGQGGGGGQGGNRQGGGQRGGAGQRPAGATGGYNRPGTRPDSTQTTRPDSTQTAPATVPADSASGAGRPALRQPGMAAPVQSPGQPGAPGTTAPASSPALKPTTPADSSKTKATTVPVGTPSDNTTSPGGITPAGSPGGRP